MRNVLAYVLLAALSCFAQAADIPAIAAASDLKFAMEEIAAGFRTSLKRDVRLVFGSSGNLYRQILQGAPFELFMSADEEFVLKLAGAGRTEDRGTLYAVGRIVLFAPHGSPVKVDAKMEGVRATLEAGHIRRFAIANPEHAPYGRAARQALEKLGLWEPLRARLVMGENVSQAAQFATGGSAEAGIFAYSLACAPGVSKLGSYVLLPQELHQPLRQRMVLIRGAGETARALYRYLQEKPAREIFVRYGFELPSGE
jgi:molybdate transport system substrate-binding protein